MTIKYKIPINQEVLDYIGFTKYSLDSNTEKWNKNGPEIKECSKAILNYINNIDRSKEKDFFKKFRTAV